MKNTDDSSNKNEIRLSKFLPSVEEGINRFLILKAENDVQATKNGDVDVLRLDIELSDDTDPSKNKIFKNHNEFINYTHGSSFHLFAQAVIRGLSVATFVPEDLVGKKGSVNLFYNTPEGSSRSYEKFNEWVFNYPSDKVNEGLQKYLKSDEFAITNEDSDFEVGDE